MTFEFALRATEILLALAIAQQSSEHLAHRWDGRTLFAARLVLSTLLLLGVAPQLVLPALLVLGVLILRRFGGPYNGGSDRMTLLILFSLTLARAAPTDTLRETAFAYLAVQLVLSYFMSGWVKLRNPDWRNGRALADVFRFSAYPVSENMRALADRRKFMWLGSWTVILYEIVFPLSLLHPTALHAALALAALFHLSNACFFGLNRFVWIWLAAYPSLLWLQARLIGQGFVAAVT